MHANTDMSGPSELPLDVVVIGGGQAGLAIAWHLAGQGIRFAVLEAGHRVGDSWRRRWDSLRLFTPAQYDGLPGMRFPAPAETYPTKDEVADYLEVYVAAFNLPVRLNAAVARLRRRDGVFEIETVSGDVVRADQVVIATGPFQRPSVPGLSAELDERVVQVHSSQYRGPSTLPDAPVLVVGGGNSGIQIAEELARSRPVTIAVGSTLRAVPRRLLGRSFFWWLSSVGLMNRSADSALGRQFRKRGNLLIGTSLRRLRRHGVDVRPRAVSAHQGTVTFVDGSTMPVGTVLWATGFQPDYGWVSISGAVVNGVIDHAQGVAAVPGLYVVGQPWQRTRGSSLLGFVKEDAAWIAGQMAKHRAAGPLRQVEADELTA